MKAPAVIVAGAARFNCLKMRERILIVVSALAAIVAMWDTLLIQPLELRRTGLTAEVDALQSSVATLSQAMEAGHATDPNARVLGQIKASERSLAAVNSELESTSAGLLPPQRMAQIIRDLLSQRHDINLVILRSKPVSSLSPRPADNTGLYLHPFELIVEGRYLDILDYLRALEALHLRLYWRLLELDNEHYPLERVRLEVGTLSLDRAWLEL
jgi:MSHA biogenesis protein MshJ